MKLSEAIVFTAAIVAMVCMILYFTKREYDERQQLIESCTKLKSEAILHGQPEPKCISII